MSNKVGPIRRLWYQWKMMHLPWRSKYLVGFDLSGNTFWESTSNLTSSRTRRIVKYPRSAHHSDIQVPPQWMQWLRHTRAEAPTLQEQQADVIRQDRIKLLAAQADARWKSKASALDAPDKQQPVQMLESRDQGSGIRQMNVDEEDRGQAPHIPGVEEKEGPSSVQQKVSETPVTEEQAPPVEKKRVMKKEPKDSPWNKHAAKGNPGEEWQPDEWKPRPARRKA